MGALVITIIGDDREGLVEAVSGAIADHGGNWEKSHMAELAGKFAGIVLATVPDGRMDAAVAALEAVDASGLLDIRIERIADEPVHGGADRLALRIVGQDHPGIVHEISQVLAANRVSIEELETWVEPAPMSGHVFKADAVLLAPADLTADEIEARIEAVAPDLMVDVDG